MKRSVDPLLRQIYQAPDDDAPRLVRADELTAAGNPRGELIAVQCAIAAGDDRPEIIRRDIEILQDHCEAFAAGYPDWMYFFVDRGFFERVRLRVDELFESDIILSEPVQQFSFTPPYTVWEEQDAKDLAAHPALTYVRELELWETVRDFDLQRLLEGKLSQLRRLDTQALSNQSLTQLARTELPLLEELVWDHRWGSSGPFPYDDRGVSALANSTTLPSLRALSLGQPLTQGNTCNCREGLQALAAGPRFGSLDRLSLSGQTDIGAETLGALFAAEEGPTSIDLSGCNLTPADLGMIAGSKRAPRLRELDVSDAQYGLAEVARFTPAQFPALRRLTIPWYAEPIEPDCLPLLDQLHALHLGNVRLSERTRDNLGQLRELVVMLDAADFAHLAEHQLPEIAHLRINYRELVAPTTYAALADAPWVSRLRSFEIPHLDHESAELIDWSRFEQLRQLTFSRIEVAALLHLLEGPPPRLREIRMIGVSLPPHRKGQPRRNTQRGMSRLPRPRGIMLRSNAEKGLRFVLRTERDFGRWWRLG